LKPQDKHLQTRVEYLIKLLKQAALEDKAEQLRKVNIPLTDGGGGARDRQCTGGGQGTDRVQEAGKEEAESGRHRKNYSTSGLRMRLMRYKFSQVLCLWDNVNCVSWMSIIILI